MNYEQLDIYDVMNEMKNATVENLQEKLEKISKIQQGYNTDLPKYYIIFRVNRNMQIEYFLNLGQGYTCNFEEAGYFNTIGVKHFNAFKCDSIEEAIKDKRHDYYAVNISNI